MVIIRKFNSIDELAVKNIQFQTYLLGKSMSKFIDNKSLVTSNIDYYLKKEPNSCFVVDNKNKVVGYLLGCLDDSKHNEFSAKIKLVLISLFKLPFLKSKDGKFILNNISLILNNILGKSLEFKLKIPPNSGHIHINILSKFRRKGIGSKLLNEFFKYAKSKGVKIIHAESFQTKLNPNTNFWKKNGFKEYDSINTSIWKKYFPHEKIKLVCYSKKL